MPQARILFLNTLSFMNESIHLVIYREFTIIYMVEFEELDIELFIGEIKTDPKI